MRLHRHRSRTVHGPGIRLAFFVSQPGFWNGSEYRFPYVNLIDFIATLSLQDEVEQIFLCVPVERRDGEGSQYYETDKLRIVRLPYWQSEFDLLRRLPVIAPRFVSSVTRCILHCNIAGATLPSFTGGSFLTIAKFADRQTFAFVRGNPRRTFASYHPRSVALLFSTLMRCLEIYGSILLRAGTICVTQASGLERQLGVKRPATVIRPLLDDQFRSSTPPTERAWPAVPRLLYVGRLSPEKNIASLISALPAIRQDCALTIVGSGPERRGLESLVQRLGVGPRVDFIGRVDHGRPLREIFERHEILVLPSHTEASSRVVAESMGMGLVTIASAVGGIPMVLGFGRNGWLIDDPTPEGVALAVNEVLAHPQEAKQRALCGWQESAQVTFSASARRLVELLSE